MSTDKPEKGRLFTFVDYDINRRGVTEVARTHLMKDRVRSKREARSEWISRNQFSPLRWMQPKATKDEPGTETMAANLEDQQELPTRPSLARRPMSHYAALIDFQKDMATIESVQKKSRSMSPTRARRKASATTSNVESRQSPSETDSPDTGLDQASPSTESWQDIPTVSADHGEKVPGGLLGRHSFETEQSQADHIGRRISLMSDSEFRLSLIEGLQIESTPLQETTDHRSAPESANEPSNEVLSELTNSVGCTPIPLLPPDCNLIRYFAANAATMIGFDRYPGIVEQYDPILTLFVPFALANQWCFETMVFLFSAYHHQNRSLSTDIDLLDAEKQYLASRQNGILARTRSRISALASHHDSSDEDVVAFLFLALSEYCAGNREIGLMHFKAWRNYCEMRRQFNVPACKLPCKTIVWWCISMLVEDDVSLHTLFNPSTRAKVREDPEKLFRYFANYDRSKATERPARPTPGERRITC
ncbi:hypothetical protein EDD36DRAFT_60959 [Exophiala viscosa]|uniref:Uncharacterized protein n=1 Tax=Exophiala viscosa TaxID=2486360 RepID=A0AAN6DRF1_9EURO|nr:hypothetical protein EDD36DRAFT_60959 [Exophiala viscosa]